MNTYLTYKNRLCSFEDYLKDAFPSYLVTYHFSPRLDGLREKHKFFVIGGIFKDYDGLEYHEFKVYDELRGLIDKKKYYKYQEMFSASNEDFWIGVGRHLVNDYVSFLVDYFQL